MNFGPKVRPRTFGCISMGSEVLFILRFRLLLYTAGSGVSIVQVVWSGYIVRLLCFVKATTICRYGCMYLFAARLLVCVDDGDVICVRHDLNRCSGWW